MLEQIHIICPYCGVGCNLELELDDKGVPVKSRASGRNKTVNDKYLCVKGLSIHELVSSQERLTHPLVRRHGTLEKAAWEEAIDQAAESLQRVMKTYGRESVGMLASSKVLNEEIYLSQKFQRVVIGNNNLDNCARLCHGPSEVALKKQLGYGAVSTFYRDGMATETIVIVGAHTSTTHPIIWQRLKKRASKGEISLVLVDPRTTGLAKYAQVHLKVKPGADIFWLKALSKIIYLQGWHDERFCRERTIGFEAMQKALEEVDIDSACEMAGIFREDLHRAAELIHGRKTIFLWGMGLTQHAHGTDNVSALIDLALLTGNVGREGCGVAPLRGQNNVQGACDLGAMPNLLPGHMLLDDEAARIHLGAIWGCEVPGKPGLAAPEMIHEIASGKIRALYVVGENPVMSEPQSTFVSWMMDRLELLIVQDVFLTETAKHANIVLPAAMIGEKEGTFTNASRRIQHTSAGLRPPGEARADWLIFQNIARAMGYDWQYGSTEVIWEEIRRAAPIFAGVTYGRLQEMEGICWPCYHESHPGTPGLYDDGFAFSDRRARFIPPSLPRSLIKPTQDYPLVLITGRLLAHFNTGEMSRRSKRLMKVAPRSFVEMHPEDADRAGLSAGESLRLTSPYGSVLSELKVTDKIAPGYVFMPIHYETPNVNTLMSAVPLDPQARMPALKVIPVKIERYVC
ncbi:MAG: formate dehydrogenase subunit alpha [Deltaproteobacteria bacterium]|nr:formate dehydrogenase subunit alpha [Deltaproteobacteria bacterium]MBW2070836.1 formate dehydrogenase subunit alpha [Deltaproteobacteria bacterium]